MKKLNKLRKKGKKDMAGKSPFIERYYAGHDYDTELSKKYGYFEINPFEQQEWNQKGYGIFWTVNEYEGNRQIQNVTKITSNGKN